MVTQAYLLERKPPPGARQRRFNQQVLPAIIDTAGGAEAMLERVAVSIRRQPLTAVAGALAVGFLVSVMRRKVRKKAVLF